MKRALPIAMVALFLAGIFIVPVGVVNTPVHLQETLLENVTLEQDSELAWLPTDKTIRVAVYNEPNTTLPDYATDGTYTNNYSIVATFLTAQGFDVTALTFQDILEHKLLTVDFDVFVMVDNLPRENITDYVKEFWLGGGGILSFNSAIGYLFNEGMIYPGVEGDFGFVGQGTLEDWGYYASVTLNVTTRHSIAKAYYENDTISIVAEEIVICNGQDMQAAIGDRYTTVVSDIATPALAAVFAIDNPDRGGRIVQIPGNCSSIPTWQESIITDSLDWLCPRPKGRILFDLTHYSFYGIDDWDDPIVDWTNRYPEWREALVNRSYTFDKLWPSSFGNLTSDNLQGYDMLIVVMPQVNFTAAEVSAVTSWVNEGGSLLVLGDQFSYTEARQNTNYLLSSYGLEWNATHLETGVSDDFAFHPMCEGLSLVSPAAGGIVNIQSPAYPIVTTDLGEVVAGAQEYGLGRVVFVSDINIFDYIRIYQNDNLHFAINIANWLTSDNAKVLVFVDSPSFSVDPNDNPYRGPVGRALNELGISWYCSSDDDYFNMSLYMYDWDLVIIDQFSANMNFFWGDLLDYVKSGERLLIQSTQLNQLVANAKEFRDYVGFAYAGNVIFPSIPIYFWEGSDQILTSPRNYVANNITTNSNYGMNSCWNLTVYDNATAFGGMSETKSGNDRNSTIILGAGGNVLVNSMTLTLFTNDTDDSTYLDNFEIWENEIAFMLRPTIDSPGDMTIEVGSTGESITWTPSSERPYSYKIVRNSYELINTVWNGGSITLDLDENNLGDVSFHVTVYDTAGASETDTVVVTKEDTTFPAFVDAPDNLQYEEGTVWHWVNWTFSDLLPDSYIFYINGTFETDGAWDGSLISVNSGGLLPSVYNLTLAVNDTSGNRASSTVYLTVTEIVTTTTTTTTTTTPTTTPTDTTTPPPGDNTVVIIVIVIAAGGVVIVIIIIMMKKKS